MAKEKFQKAKRLFQNLGDNESVLAAQKHIDTLEGRDGLAEAESPPDSCERSDTSIDAELVRSMADAMCQGGHLDKELTEAEVELFSANPDKVARLKEIADYAKEKASHAYREDRRVPEDAYRHVLWSYLLTKEYGASFAKKVTDAHEIGDDENTAAEHKMDFSNNATGREYAEKGYRESDILGRLMTDPDVIRTPQDDKSR